MTLPIVLEIRDVGNIKSLKNNKMVPRYGQKILTKPEAWKQQKKIVDELESQLYCALGISEDMTLMEQREQYSTVSSELVEDLLTSLPSDDNYLMIPDSMKLSVNLDKGEEGAIIYIEKYTPSLLEKVKGGFDAVRDKAIEIFKVKNKEDPWY